MIGTRRIGTAVAVGAIGKTIAIVVLIVTALGLRHDGTVYTSPSRRALASESARLAVLQANATIVTAVSGTSIYNTF